MIIYKLIQLIFELFGLNNTNTNTNTNTISKRNDQIIIVSSSNSCKMPTVESRFSFKKIYEENEII